MVPDPARDVMVYEVEMVDALEGASLGGRWTVWVGAESEGSFESAAEAIAAAAQLANDYGVTAWLVKGDGSSSAL